MGRAVFPPCCLTWGQTMVEVMTMVTSFKRFHACTASLSASNPTAGHCRLMPLPEIAGHSWACLGQFLVRHCFIFLGPGEHKILFLPSNRLFPQTCVSSGGSMVGLMATSFKRAYAIPRSAAPRAPAAGHCWPYLPRRHSDTVLAQSLWVWCVLWVFPRSEQLRQPGAWQAHCTRWAMPLSHLPSPGCSVSQCEMKALSRVWHMFPLESWSQAAKIK